MFSHVLYPEGSVRIVRRAAFRTLLATLLVVPLAAQPGPPPAAVETFVALAMNMTAGVGPTGGGTIMIEIARWSTAEERTRAESALRQNGPEGLLSVLHSLEAVGTLRTPSTAGFALKYALASPLAAGGRRIVIATERPIGRFRHPTSLEEQTYPFTVIELRLDADDRGDGRVALFARLGVDPQDGALTVEDYTEAPIRLAGVKKTTN